MRSLRRSAPKKLNSDEVLLVIKRVVQHQDLVQPILGEFIRVSAALRELARVGADHTQCFFHLAFGGERHASIYMVQPDDLPKYACGLVVFGLDKNGFIETTVSSCVSLSAKADL